uniref:Uncharacterized protein n=1 Tax=Pithovirus LCPAC404 TaxID=2506597 RepID=A0A481ZD60_9VIRU|nr:MAG: hypothetical protein LCPAC404_01290 [Pithovirus LCPAC404]
MRHLDENLVIYGFGERGTFQYYDKLEFLFEIGLEDESGGKINDYSDVYDEDGNICISDNFMKKLEKDGLKDKWFDCFVDNEFDNDTLWLEVGEPEPMILTM